NADGSFRIENGGQLWGLLVTITVCKAQAKARYHTAQKRDARAELSAEESRALLEAVARGPSPDDAASLADTIEKLPQGLPYLYKNILALLLEGCSKQEIA